MQKHTPNRKEPNVSTRSNNGKNGQAAKVFTDLYKRKRSGFVIWCWLAVFL